MRDTPKAGDCIVCAVPSKSEATVRIKARLTIFLSMRSQSSDKTLHTGNR
jgi:hypothetical protein